MVKFKTKEYVMVKKPINTVITKVEKTFKIGKSKNIQPYNVLVFESDLKKIK
jgi:hypothetical protein